jgi:hypothetical protein
VRDVQRMERAVLVCAFLMPLSASAQDQTKWRVATDGRDSTGDGSASSPVQTIQYAIDAASDGDMVIVLEGRQATQTMFSGWQCVVQAASNPKKWIVSSHRPALGFISNVSRSARKHPGPSALLSTDRVRLRLACPWRESYAGQKRVANASLLWRWWVTAR